MLHFRSLDVYRSAIAFVPKAYALAEDLDRDLAHQLRRAAMMLPLHLAEESLAAARASALQSAAILDIARSLERSGRAAGSEAAAVDELDALLARIISAI